MQSERPHDSTRWQRVVAGSTLSLMLLLGVGIQSARAEGSLSEPAPRTALNGAIHYQRAILFLTTVDPAKRAVLEKPIWEIVNPDTTDAEIAELNQLLIESRHAIRAALVGANQSVADFGMDIRQYMVSSLIPHNRSMVHLARLVALVGIHRESEGRWREAAETYFAALRMGRHMTHQTTLAEAFTGVEVLETAYFSLGRWAAHCPDSELIAEAFDTLAASTYDIAQPARTMQSEASILRMRMNALRDAYPDGPWAEMVLETLGADYPAADPEEMRKAAIAAAIEHGVPQDAFSSKESLLGFLDKLSATYIDMASETALCLTLPPADAIRKGIVINQKYQQKLVESQNTSNWDAAKIASLFAVHQAELRVLRTVMAVSAAKTAGRLPADLSAVASAFGGDLPKSPYDGSPLVYEVSEDGKGFSVSAAAAQIGNVELPEIKFSH